MFVQEIMDGTLSLEQYKIILATNYFIHLYLEDPLFQALSEPAATELGILKRRKLPALLLDMKEVSLDEAGNAMTDPGLSMPENDAASLGALYVLEGATLGGQVIVKKLKANPAFNKLNFHYYQVYGSNSIPFWKEFCSLLNKQPSEGDAAAIAGAKKMYENIYHMRQILGDPGKDSQ